MLRKLKKNYFIQTKFEYTIITICLYLDTIYKVNNSYSLVIIDRTALLTVSRGLLFARTNSCIVFQRVVLPLPMSDLGLFVLVKL